MKTPARVLLQNIISACGTLQNASDEQLEQARDVLEQIDDLFDEAVYLTDPEG